MKLFSSGESFSRAHVKNFEQINATLNQLDKYLWKGKLLRHVWMPSLIEENTCWQTSKDWAAVVIEKTALCVVPNPPCLHDVFQAEYFWWPKSGETSEHLSS